jgi:hypothetical protein
VIEHRDALIYMLNEAAELEHAIACQYLYAAFSMKRSSEEGVDARQLESIKRWRKLIVEIATEEMLHLALVNNLLTSIGAAPRLGRPNLPQRGRYYPPGVQLAFVPFGERALRHFLFLERPEGITLQDAEGFESLEEAEPLLMSEEDIVPRPQHFQTVGHLYRAIEEGFAHLVERHGEEWVFLGDEYAQAMAEAFWWNDLVRVTDLASARKAIETVVEQGEGPRGHWRDAHYGRLLVILGEYLTMKKANPDFEPSRPVEPACVSRILDAEPGIEATEPFTARVLDAFNVAYEIMLQVLARYFAHGHERDEQLQILADVAVGLMVRVITPLGDLATMLPIGPEAPGRTAGPSFEVFYRSGFVLPHTRQAWILIHERIHELDAFLGRFCLGPAEDIGGADTIRAVSKALAGFADKMAGGMEGLGDRVVAPPASWRSSET